ncbi:tetratricopeptide repeat protein [Sphingobacterium sp. SGR-19]|uniref:tetratricopeptide repeat protein n=1 Tax=Sphingobacterium sp. SGR-19 TaxID=2710886 RepID=UPI0013EA643D|nr:tetratricopeptide repeat protein [Sphingobacterium sp. SGR-19]NGM63704.1 tetratricopeptide repeat protein [Sphingobacterium sp. SGR-19]
MSLKNNRNFLLASAQLFPLTFLEPVEIAADEPALTRAREAFTSYRNGQPKIALEQYAAAIQQFSDQPFFYACRSILNMALGDEEGAFYDYQVAKNLDFNYQAFLEWVENRPKEETRLWRDIELKEILSDALETTQQFDYEHALKLYAYAHEKYPEDVDVLVYRGALHLRLLRYDKALSDLNQAIAMNSEHFQAYLFRAKLFKAIQEHGKARVDFDRSVEVQPDASVTYEERGGFLADLKLYEEALLDFNKLVSLIPEDFYVYALRGDLFEKLENWEAALQDYSTAITLNPYYSDLYAYRADMRDRLGDTIGAAEDRRMFEELEKED